MKLVRYGKPGKEKPGLIDEEGALRDLSGVVTDVDPATLAPKSLARLAKIKPARLPLVRGKQRLGPPLTGASKFVAGPQPTIADVAIFPWVATAEEGGFDVARYPNVRDWAERMLKLPGAAHPYAIMPKEDRVAA